MSLRALLGRRLFRYPFLASLGLLTLGTATFYLPPGQAIALSASVGLAILSVAGIWYLRQPLLELSHAPKRVSRRAGALSANVCGIAHYLAKIRYRLNEGDWIPVIQRGDRSPRPYFTIELELPSLHEGANTVVIEARVLGRGKVTESVAFTYMPTALRLPFAQDWEDPNLEAQDGCWEAIDTPSGRRVRPRPGTERYDRILLATNAFPVARRIETEMIYRGRGASRAQQFGFGVLTLWGGHPDEPGHRPRRGWRYAAAWFFSSVGVCAEFSCKDGGARRWDTATYVNGRVTAGSHYRLVAECWQQHAEDGRHLRYGQRMKWWLAGQPEPDDWLQILEGGQARLPMGDYAVALLAHQCQVEFGPVKVTALAQQPV